MSDNGTTVYSIFIRGTADAVWREITKTDALQKCFFNCWLEVDKAAAGGQFRMRSASRKTTSVVGEIKEFDPPRRYVHTMRFTSMDDPEWTVIHEIKPADGGVQYTMTQVGMIPGSKSAKQATQGAKFIGDCLKSVVETGRPTLLARILYPVFRLLEPMLPARCRSERWPL